MSAITNLIGIVFLAAILGTIFGILISRIIFKRKSNKIKNDAADKIMKQDKVYIMDGKKYDLKAEIKSEISKAKVEEEKKQIDSVPSPSSEERNFPKKVNTKLIKKMASDDPHKSNKKEVKKIWQKKTKNLKKKKIQKNKKRSKK